MTSDRDGALVTRICEGTGSAVLEADDPPAVAAAVADATGAVPCSAQELPHALAAARVRVAETVVDRARGAESALAARLADHGTTPDARAPDADDDGPEADRQAVRFALVILVLSLAGGIAVYVIDGLLLAPALPAAALVALGIVVLAHRRPEPPPRRTTPSPAAPVAAGRAGTDRAPAVRAAEAHLRRQQAAWKVSWWERGRPVPDLGDWTSRLPATPPITLVVVDGDRHLGPDATMTATAPAAVRVVVLQARG